MVTNLAKTILPPLAKAVDFLGKNIKIILPLVAEAVVGIKAFKIVQSATKWFDAMKTAIAAAGAATSAEALATAASTGAITLKQIAVGVLTGENRSCHCRTMALERRYERKSYRCGQLLW